MQIEVQTKKSKELKTQILKVVEEEVVKTWVVRQSNGRKFLTHKPEQWYDKVLIGFTEEEDKLIFSINWWENYGEPSKDIKGYYIGRLTELLIVNFSDKFNRFEIKI